MPRIASLVLLIVAPLSVSFANSDTFKEERKRRGELRMEISRLLLAQDYVRAEAKAREHLVLDELIAKERAQFGYCYLARALFQQGKLTEAAPLFKKGIWIAADGSGIRSGGAEAVSDYGLLLAQQGKWAEAKMLYYVYKANITGILGPGASYATFPNLVTFENDATLTRFPLNLTTYTIAFQSMTLRDRAWKPRLEGFIESLGQPWPFLHLRLAEYETTKSGKESRRAAAIAACSNDEEREWCQAIIEHRQVNWLPVVERYLTSQTHRNAKTQFALLGPTLLTPEPTVGE